MRLHAKFICAEHQEYGYLGWKMASRPWTDPITDMGIPHDIMEHTVEQEFQALGASIHVRDSMHFYVEIELTSGGHCVRTHERY